MAIRLVQVMHLVTTAALRPSACGGCLFDNPNRRRTPTESSLHLFAVSIMPAQLDSSRVDNTRRETKPIAILAAANYEESFKTQQNKAICHTGRVRGRGSDGGRAPVPQANGLGRPPQPVQSHAGSAVFAPWHRNICQAIEPTRHVTVIYA